MLREINVNMHAERLHGFVLENNPPKVVYVIPVITDVNESTFYSKYFNRFRILKFYNIQPKIMFGKVQQESNS